MTYRDKLLTLQCAAKVVNLSVYLEGFWSDYRNNPIWNENGKISIDAQTDKRFTAIVQYRCPAGGVYFIKVFDNTKPIIELYCSLHGKISEEVKKEASEFKKFQSNYQTLKKYLYAHGIISFFFFLFCFRKTGNQKQLH
ncbi:MAG: hypothetical protein PHP62_06135 [Candidatus Moranbacteria bacterium]|nr:hypothetical protein [Candidatus Moranbacteria bacterium]